MRATVRNQVYDTYKARMADRAWMSDRRAILANFYKLEEEMVRSSAMAPRALLCARAPFGMFSLSVMCFRLRCSGCRLVWNAALEPRSPMSSSSS